ncbi:MAG: YhjD/YihY/BrkB family envelope integrity protein, partial [Burkholderiaceae bacterium]
IAMEMAKKLLVVYLANVPTYSVVYGTFATVPILLVWIYLVWVIVLLGAVIAAYLPSLLSGVARRGLGAGWRFQLALETVRLLDQAREMTSRGQTVAQLAKALRVSALGIDSALEALVEIDWVARLDDDANPEGPRYVLLVDPTQTPLAPLLEALLLRHNSSTEALWERAQFAQARLGELLGLIAGQVLVVHCRDIERRFIDAALKARIGEGLQFPVIDTMELEARLYRHAPRRLRDRLLGRKPPWVSIRLADSRARYGLPRYRPHHAMTDALASAELLQAQVAHRYAPDVAVRALWR